MNTPANGAGCDQADACVMDPNCEFYIACTLVEPDEDHDSPERPTCKMSESDA